MNVCTLCSGARGKHNMLTGLWSTCPNCRGTGTQEDKKEANEMRFRALKPPYHMTTEQQEGYEMGYEKTDIRIRHDDQDNHHGYADGFYRGEEFYCAVEFGEDSFYFRKKGRDLLDIPQEVFEMLRNEILVCPTCGHVGKDRRG